MSPPNTTTQAVVGKAALFGFVGWAAENVLFKDRYSAMWQGKHVPWLPSYAIGGLVITGVEPYIKDWPMPIRAISYALLGTGVEWVGCQIDRHLLDAHSWDYGESDHLARATSGCVDWKHTAIWGVLGMLTESVFKK